jgi:hypothetical protein
MADLGSKATDGRLSFVKYVTDNKRFAEIEFEIEKGKDSALFTKAGSQLKATNKIYKAGTKIKILDPKLHMFEQMKLASSAIGTTKGFLPINKIRKPTAGNGTQYEDEVVDLINGVILENGGAIDIRLKGSSKIYKGILYAVKVDNTIKQAAGVKGDPKADIILCQDKKRPLAPTSIYISHKKEGGPEAFQQYGGLSLTSGRVINDHSIVQKFLGLVADAIGDTNKLPAPIMANFKDDKLANAAIFGPDFGKDFSVNHTQLIGQGKPKLTNVSAGKVFELDFSSHMSLSGDLSHFKGGYLPVLGASYRAGRSFEYQGKRYNGARVGFYPWKLVAGRSGTVVYNL